MARYAPKRSPGIEALKFDGTAKSADEVIRTLPAPYDMQWITEDNSSGDSEVKLFLTGLGPQERIRCEILPGYYVMRYEHDSRMDFMVGSVFEDRYEKVDD